MNKYSFIQTVWGLNLFSSVCFQVELEKLNNATDEINKLEKELDVSPFLPLFSIHVRLYFIYFPFCLRQIYEQKKRVE